MTDSDGLFDSILGESLSGSVHHQDLEELGDELQARLKENGESGNKYDHVALFSNESVSLSLFWMEPGACLRDVRIGEGTVGFQVVRGRVCFQACEHHRHPGRGEVFYLGPDTGFSLQADRPSLVLLMVFKQNTPGEA